MESNDQNSCINCVNSLHLRINVVCWWAYCFPLISNQHKSGERPTIMLWYNSSAVSKKLEFYICLLILLQTTYENFRYRYDRRGNPYNKGVIQNFMEIFCTSTPSSKNNFRAKVPRETGFPPARSGGWRFYESKYGKSC